MSAIKSESDSTKMEEARPAKDVTDLAIKSTTDSLTKLSSAELYLAGLYQSKLRLAKPQASFETTRFVVPSNIARKDPLITGSFLRLPPEISLRIIEEMDEDVDRLCLGLSCRRLLHLVQERKIRVPCMKASREARFLQQDNKLAFSMMKRVHPLNAIGEPRPGTALCQSCFKWKNMNHFATTTIGQRTTTVLSQVVSLRDRQYNPVGVLFECAQCVARDSTPREERERRQRIHGIGLVSEPTEFCSSAVWTGRVNMHNGSEVDP